MTVAELIAALQEMPQEANVVMRVDTVEGLSREPVWKVSDIGDVVALDDEPT